MTSHIKNCVLTLHNKNGLAEKKHRHIIKTTKTLVITSQVPKDFWVEATVTVVYLINKMSSSSLKNVSPIEKLFKLILNYSRLRVFGCKCFVFTNKNDKFFPCVIPCVFLRYENNQKGYRCDFRTKKLCLKKCVLIK